MRDLSVRSREDELMDGPDLSQETMDALLRDLSQASTLTLARRPTLRWLRRTVRGRTGQVRIVDVGSGEGDMLRAVAARLPRWGVTAELTGYDLNPRCTASARAASEGCGITYRTGDATTDVTDTDIVLCSLVAHHMTDDQLTGFLRWASAASHIGWFVNDLRRHPFAYHGFSALAGLLRWHPIVRHDGALSVARSFTEADWRDYLERAGVDGRIERWFPFRLCVSGRR